MLNETYLLYNIIYKSNGYSSCCCRNHSKSTFSGYIFDKKIFIYTFNRCIKLVIATNEMHLQKKIVKDALNPKAQRATVSHADRYESEKNVRIVLGLLRHDLAIDEDISM